MNERRFSSPCMLLLVTAGTGRHWRGPACRRGGRAVLLVISFSAAAQAAATGRTSNGAAPTATARRPRATLLCSPLLFCLLFIVVTL